MMNNKKNIYFIFLFIFPCICSIGQTPVGSGVGYYDQNWNISSLQFSDNFANLSQWNIADGWCYSLTNSPPYYYGDESTMVTTSGPNQLQLKADAIPYSYCPTSITSGQMLTKSEYTYGYYEAKMELPCYGADYNDAFWLYECTATPNVHKELDCEILSTTSNNSPGRTSPLINYSTNTWIGQCYGSSVDDYQQYVPSANLSTNYHVYSFEWLPDHIIWYFDGAPFRMVHLSSPNITIPASPMYIFLELGLEPNVSVTRDQFPGYMYVQYVHSYYVNEDCNTNTVFNSYANILSFNYAVKNTITFGTGTPISLLNTDVKYFRAQSGFTIKGPFTVPKGAVFGLIETGCYTIPECKGCQ